MGEAGFEGISKSVTRKHNTVVQNILTRTLLDLCERSTRQPVARVSWRWLENSGIELEGSKKRAAEAATDSDSESDLDLSKDESSGVEERMTLEL